MSHNKVRDEKICLNCGAPCPGRYCSACGQENIEPKQSVWHLVNHFFSDITHFDGKFFVTVADLVRRPGFLSREYVKGRRVSYLDPIRMYIFTSAFFFVIFFSIVHLHDMETGKLLKDNLNKKIDLSGAKARILQGAKTHEDSVNLLKSLALIEGKSGQDFLNGVREENLAEKIARKAREKSVAKANDSTEKADEADSEDSADKADPDPGRNEKLDLSDLTEDSDMGELAKTVQGYDSLQSKLKPDRRDGFFKRIVKRRLIEVNEKWHDNKSAAITEWIATFFHNFPKLLFISLPIFALLLKLLYLRRKEFYYVDHGIFAVHLYIFSFLDLLLIFACQQLKTWTHWGLFGWLGLFIGLFSIFYYYKAMRNFYHQGRFKTICKYLLLLFMSFVVLITLFAIFFLLSVAQS